MKRYKPLFERKLQGKDITLDHFRDALQARGYSLDMIRATLINLIREFDRDDKLMHMSGDEIISWFKSSLRQRKIRDDNVIHLLLGIFMRDTIGDFSILNSIAKSME